jgi:hypothetical protein
MEAEDQFTLTPTEPPAGLTPPGVVILTPEQQAEAARVPYEKADRTPDGPLLELHAFAAERLGVRMDVLVSLAGQVAKHGSVALFARNAEESAQVDPVGWVIASYDERYPTFKLQLRGTEAMARVAFAHRVQVLS